MRLRACLLPGQHVCDSAAPAGLVLRHPASDGLVLRDPDSVTQEPAVLLICCLQYQVPSHFRCRDHLAKSGGSVHGATERAASTPNRCRGAEQLPSRSMPQQPKLEHTIVAHADTMSVSTSRARSMRTRPVPVHGSSVDSSGTLRTRPLTAPPGTQRVPTRLTRRGSGSTMPPSTSSAAARSPRGQAGCWAPPARAAPARRVRPPQSIALPFGRATLERTRSRNARRDAAGSGTSTSASPGCTSAAHTSPAPAYASRAAARRRNSWHPFCSTPRSASCGCD
jgi:hypothetical protein